MVKLVYAVEAREEIVETARYYENCKSGLGRAFLEELESAVQVIQENPLRWRRIKGVFRRYLLRKFPYGIIYSFEEEEIFVAAVMHQRRRPGYWIGRVGSSDDS